MGWVGWLLVGCVQDLTCRTVSMALHHCGVVALVGRRVWEGAAVVHRQAFGTASQSLFAFYKEVCKLVSASCTERTGSPWSRVLHLQPYIHEKTLHAEESACFSWPPARHHWVLRKSGKLCEGDAFRLTEVEMLHEIRWNKLCQPICRHPAILTMVDKTMRCGVGNLPFGFEGR